jgi:hypothetical protein
MQDLSEYRITISGQVDAEIFNVSSPLQISVVEEAPDSTQAVVYTDQSGLIGLIRHLHRQGFLLLLVIRDLPENHP